MGTFADGETGLSVRTKINAAIEAVEAITPATIKTDYESNLDTNAYDDAAVSKLAGIEALADVTDTANVTAAGALMDSELTNIAAVTALDQGVSTTDAVTFASLVTDESQSHRNKIINGDFAVNQRAKSGTVTLAAGEYGHDRWKAGASGCTYTFATSANITTLTITAGSLIQVINGSDLQSGTHTLSWTGTAQGKIGVGSYSASGVTGTATGGTNLNIEFNTGTLSLVQFEAGTVSTAFEHITYNAQLLRCLPYAWLAARFSGGDDQLAMAHSRSSTAVDAVLRPPVTMRATPTLEAPSITLGYRFYNGTSYPQTVPPVLIAGSSPDSVLIQLASLSGLTSGTGGRIFLAITGAYVLLTADL